MTLPFVSVLFPTKNDEQFIATTLIGLHQELTRYEAAGGRTELIVVNDGSTDATPLAIRTVLGAYGRAFRFVDRADNWGVTKSLEQAMGLTDPSSELILRCDADARFITAGWLELMARFLVSDERVGVVAPMTVFPNGTVDFHGVNYFPGGRKPVGNGLTVAEVPFDRILEVDAVLGCYSLMRRSDWEVDTGYFLWIEDEDQSVSVRSRGKKVFSIGPAVCVHYNRIRASRVSDRKFGEKSGAGAYRPGVPSRVQELRRGIASLARATTPDIVRRGYHRYLKPVPPQQPWQIVWANSLARFIERWGFHPDRPDMAAVRTRFAGTEVLWSESENSRATGREIAARFAREAVGRWPGISFSTSDA